MGTEIFQFGTIRAEKTRFEVTYPTLNKTKDFRLYLTDEVSSERPKGDLRMT